MVARSFAPVILALLLLTGCGTHIPQRAQAQAGVVASPVADTAGLPVDDPNAPMPAPGSCKLGTRDGQPLPDPRCTPGAVNPNVHQDNIARTICQPGWTATVRPPTAKTNAMKAASARSYSLAPNQNGEYDHLLSGGVARTEPICAAQIVSPMPLTRAA
jgi:hypothetical protein